MIQAASLSFLVPTHMEGRPLKRALDSIAPQLGPADEVIVVGDTYDGPLPGVEQLVKSFGFRYIDHDAGRHTFGHDQLNYGLRFARGDYWHCSDDDDAWAPGAVEKMRKAITADPGKVHLFRFRAYNGLTYWLRQGLVERDTIGGHCLVAPNIVGKYGEFGSTYSGDFDMVESTVNLNGGPEAAVWHNQIVAIARPTSAVYA